MKLAKLSYCALSGLLLVSGGAQAAGAKPAAVKPGSGAAASQQTTADVRERLLKDATGLIKAGKAAEAYALLSPQQSERAGDPDFDYLLGLAALDSGKPNEAIFALERVLAVKPDHLQARAEIARAYVATGEKVAARQEFETVQSQNPPKEVSATIQKFLDALNQGESGERTTVRGFLEATVGSDSNVNSATGSSQIAVPAFGGAIATLAATGVQLHDTFGSLGGGLNVRHALSPEWALFGGANFNQRLNSSQSAFDNGVIDGSVGVNLTQGDNSYSAALQLQSFSVDNRRYREGTGLTLQWQHNLDGSSQLSSYYQYTQLQYPGQAMRNADRNVLGAAYASILGGEYTPVIYAGGYFGNEKERGAGVPHLGHDVYGLRAGGEMKLNAQTKLFGSLSAESRRYGGADPLFLVTRDDTQIDLKLGLSYVFASQWTVSPQVGYTDNNSNIVINDYKRSVFSVSVRRDFN